MRYTPASALKRFCGQARALALRYERHAYSEMHLDRACIFAPLTRVSASSGSPYAPVKHTKARSRIRRTNIFSYRPIARWSFHTRSFSYRLIFSLAKSALIDYATAYLCMRCSLRSGLFSTTLLLRLSLFSTAFTNRAFVSSRPSLFLHFNKKPTPTLCAVRQSRSARTNVITCCLCPAQNICAHGSARGNQVMPCAETATAVREHMSYCAAQAINCSRVL